MRNIYDMNLLSLAIIKVLLTNYLLKKVREIKCKIWNHYLTEIPGFTLGTYLPVMLKCTQKNSPCLKKFIVIYVCKGGGLPGRIQLLARGGENIIILKEGNYYV
jgi:hypothetical protein